MGARDGGLHYSDHFQGFPGSDGNGFDSGYGSLLKGPTVLLAARSADAVWVPGRALAALAGADNVKTVPERAASPNMKAAAVLARRVLIIRVPFLGAAVAAGLVEKRIEPGPLWIPNEFLEPLRPPSKTCASIARGSTSTQVRMVGGHAGDR